MPMLGGAEAIAACGAALRLRRDGTEIAPELAERLDAVLGALGVRDAVDALDEHELTALLGVVEGFLAQALDLVGDPRARAGITSRRASSWRRGTRARCSRPSSRASSSRRWAATSRHAWTRRARPSSTSACGVAALSVAMCRAWPALRVVGVDPWEPALALAREHVAAAGLADRIELRATTAEQLSDDAAYDLAWVPTFFIPAAVLDEGGGVVERVHAALRPGGGVIFGLYARPDNPVAAAVADLRTVRQGGTMCTPSELAELVARCGFEDVEVRFDAAWGPVVYVVGRRVR